MYTTATGYKKRALLLREVGRVDGGGRLLHGSRVVQEQRRGGGAPPASGKALPRSAAAAAAAACWIFSAPERYREGQCVVVVQTTSEFQLVLDSAIMEIIKSIRTWKPLKKSKSAQSNKSCPKSAQSVQNSVGSDSSDNYCYSGTVVQCSSQENNSYVQENNSYVLSQTSLVSASSVAASDSLYSPAPARPASVAASSGYHKVEPLTKPPPHFLRPKQQPQQPHHHMYQGRKYNQLLTLYTQLGSARDAIKVSTSVPY